MSAFENLKDKLREIFQLDRNDLDFGLYRIMNLKSEEVSKFIEEDLLPQVKNGLASYAAEDSVAIKEELDKTVASLRAAGLPEEQINVTPKVVELNEKLKDVSKDEYNLMRKNAKKCSERVRKGYYLKKAIQEALS